jgi:hypothetical protein
MDPADLLDFALGRLEGVECQRIERAMARDPAFADQVCRLRRCVHLLLDDELEEETFVCPLIALELGSRAVALEAGAPAL